jgi:AbrB family looped-hinge helix DNA binding protein
MPEAPGISCTFVLYPTFYLCYTIHMKTAYMPTVSFTTKGQVVIPVQIRRMFGIGTGTRAVVTATREGILLRPVTDAVIDAGCGILRPHKGLPALAEERALYKVEEKELEERRARRRS